MNIMKKKPSIRIGEIYRINNRQKRYRQLVKHSQFVNHSKIEDFLANELKLSVGEALDKVVPEEARDCGELETTGHCSHYHADDMGFNTCRAEVLRRIELIKKEYGIE